MLHNNLFDLCCHHNGYMLKLLNIYSYANYQKYIEHDIFKCEKRRNVMSGRETATTVGAATSEQTRN